MYYYVLPPTEKQIKFAEKLCKQLNITDFLSCSNEFTKLAYYNFIKWAVKEVDNPTDHKSDEYECNEPDGYDYDYWDAILGEQY